MTKKITQELIERVAGKVGTPSYSDRFDFDVVGWVNTHPDFNSAQKCLCHKPPFFMVHIWEDKDSEDPQLEVFEHEDWFHCYLLAADALPERNYER